MIPSNHSNLAKKCLLAALLLAFSLGLFVDTVQSSYVSGRKQKQDQYKLVCYMTNWAQYRPNATKFRPSDMDPFLCTHAIFAFAAINTSSHEIRAFEWNDESTDDLLVGRYEEFNNLKKLNPNLKTMLAVGGWTMGSGPFSEVSKDETKRFIFVRSVVKFLRKWRFDGLDLDWEFPAKREGSCPEDKKYFSYLVRELREAFYVDAMENRRDQMLLSAAMAAEKYTILSAYEIENIVTHLDFINLMSYDYHGSWDRKLGHNSPLYASHSDSLDNHRLTIDWTVRLYLTLGVPLEKLVVGIPFYGRSFTLKNKNQRGFGSECAGEGKSGEFTRENGFLSYGLEICKYIEKDNWTRVWSREHQVPFAYKKDQWVGYDDEESITIKVDYIKKHCLGGAMIWSIDLDDFSGYCSNITYPLTKSILANLKTIDRKKCDSLPRIEDPEVQNYLRTVKKWVPSSEEFINDDFEELYSEHSMPNFKKNKFLLSNSKYANLGATEYKPKTTVTYAPPTSATKTIRSQASVTWPGPAIQTHTYKIPNNKYQNSIHNVESRAKKLNDLILLTYVRSNYQKNNLLNQVLQDYLTNLTKLHIDDSGLTSAGNTAARNSKELLFDSFKQIPMTSNVAAEMLTYKPVSSLKANGVYLPCETAADGELIRDINDCSSFYTCFMGKEIKKSTCEKGLYFDMSIKVCNWESQVAC